MRKVLLQECIFRNVLMLFLIFFSSRSLLICSGLRPYLSFSSLLRCLRQLSFSIFKSLFFFLGLCIFYRIKGKQGKYYTEFRRGQQKSSSIIKYFCISDYSFWKARRMDTILIFIFFLIYTHHYIIYNMPKNNNKNKKIAKQLKGKQNVRISINPQQGQDELQQMQGQFEQLPEEMLDARSQPTKKVATSIQEQQVKQQIPESNNFFHSLKCGKAYKVTNLQNDDLSITVVEGVFVSNGKVLNRKDKVKIRGTSSIVVQVQQQNIAQSLCLQELDEVLSFSNKEKKMTKEDKQLLLQTIHKEENCGCLYLNNGNQNANKTLKIVECSHPWAKLDLKPFLTTNQTTLLIGLKNSGKSTLCQYIINTTLSGNPSFTSAFISQNKEIGSPRPDICILDLDVGRNRLYPGCISLTVVQNRRVAQEISIWVGEYTVLNNHQTYLKAVSYLYHHLYRSKYFGSGLIINTMGYVTGLGELLIYEIFNIVKPHRVVFMEGSETPLSHKDPSFEGFEKQQHKNLSYIKNKLMKKQYSQKLHFSKAQKDQQQRGTSFQVKTLFVDYMNDLAETKAAAARFEYLISPASSLRSFDELVDIILKGNLKKLAHHKHYEIYQQDKMGGMQHLQWVGSDSTDMRLAILAYAIEDKLLEVVGVGFGWKGAIYYDPTVAKLRGQIMAVVLTDGIDFERSFYQMNESKLIWMEQIVGGRIPYLTPVLKVLGNRGLRNNPGKRLN